MDKYGVLKQYFGYTSFREGQEELIDGLLNGRDVVGIMPTGSGKSLCFQLPALLKEGITLVISPLISLMSDQVSALNQAGVHAAYLNSSLSLNQYLLALRYARQGRYTIIYVAPERLETDAFLDFALNVKISMLIVDEAHCISEWGQDFRPSYLKIADFIEKLPERPVIGAFTATATDEVRADIVRLLTLGDPLIVATGYDRPNLFLGVKRPVDKYSALKDVIAAHPGESGIVYCQTRKLVEEVCERLTVEGISATRYHAGLSDSERKKNQEEFIYDRSLVMVATNAFGMGIDKADVRFVVNYNMPKSIEEFYQEIGRCSRDGERGDCILFYSAQDVRVNNFLIEKSQENNSQTDPQVRMRIEELDKRRLKKMIDYCFRNECYREYILRYFGEFKGNYCGNCENCLSQFETVNVTQEARAVIGSVDACNGRYGINVILDTVCGLQNEKVQQYGMDRTPYFSSLKSESKPRVRQILEYLILENYLRLTSDEYPVLKLTETSGKILDGTQAVSMKLIKKAPVKAAAAKNVAVEKEESGKTFEKLKRVRSRLAKEQKVPAYLIFPDRTLEAMCVYRPRTAEEMSRLPGVGATKLKRYGEAFLSCLNGTEEASRKEDQAKQAEAKVKKKEFCLSQEMARKVTYSESELLSRFVERINATRNEDTMKRLTIRSVEAWMAQENLIRIKPGLKFEEKNVTLEGSRSGVSIETRTGRGGTEYGVVCCDERMQKRIIAYLTGCMEEPS